MSNDSEEMKAFIRQKAAKEILDAIRVALKTDSVIALKACFKQAEIEAHRAWLHLDLIDEKEVRARPVS